MKNRGVKRILATALTVCMTVSMLPSMWGASAAEPVGVISSVTFVADNTIVKAGVDNVSRLELGQTMGTTVTALTTSGQKIDDKDLSIMYVSHDKKLVSVNSNRELQASNEKIGMTTVHATATYEGRFKTGDLIVCVSGKNLLEDGSFEVGSTGRSWASNSGIRPLENAKDGKNVYQVTLDPSKNGQKQTMKLKGDRLIPVESGKFYELSGWVKVSDFADGVDEQGETVSNRASIEVEYYNTNSDSAVPVEGSKRSYTVTGNLADWTYFSVPVYAPRAESAKFATVRVVTGTGTDRISGLGGTFTYDALSFHEVNVNKVSITYGEEGSDTLRVGENLQTNCNILMSNNELLTVSSNNAVLFESSNSSVATVDQTGLVRATGVGEAEITAHVDLNGNRYTATQKIRVMNDVFNAAYAFGNTRGIKVGESRKIFVTGRMQSGATADMGKARITYSSANPSVASVAADGTIKAIKEGSADITVTVFLGGITKQTVVPVVVGKAKNASTIYTTSKVAAARENVQKYDWAKKELATAVAFADKIVDQPDLLWNAVPSQKVPRGITVGFIYDPDAWTCAYCGVDLRAKHGSYPYYMDPINKPWKIRCPDCQRWFPSNDFESYYKSGLNQQGEFVPDLADKSLLKNDLYPEKGEGWGVDDGYGYVTGKIQPNGVREVKTWIAYYNHWGLWRKTADKSENTALLETGLESLRNAYLYTGDIRYGRTGAILLDRIADLYPDFKLMPYRDFYNSHGLGYEGKIIGRIWETDLATDLARAYDAFYPAMEDPQVISYLSNKAKEHGLVNPKTSASMIRENGENNILRNIYQEVQNANIFGNFGMHQTSLLTAAVALDTMPDTGHMIDFAFQEGEYVHWENPRRCSGGNVLAQLVDKVDRDGHGNEAGPGYNILWLNQMVNIASVLDGYTGYAGADLYKNPKFLKMFSAMYPLYMASRYTAQIGDSGATGNTGFVGSAMNTTLGFMKTGDPKLAQAAYLINGNSTQGLRADIFTKDPERVAQDIEKIIKEQGPLNLTSNMLAGYGFTALRDGEMSEEDDTQRDFWMYFGRTNGHGHLDAANLGIHAFGLDLAPDLGYPEQTGVTPNRMQWVRNTISHNSVVVNTRGQDEAYDARPIHFDDTEEVKLFDVQFDNAYTEADIYRRGLVMVKVDDTVSYGVDFFRVRGGNDHIYSFHAQSDEISETTGLQLTAQARGTYAGTGVEWGPGDDTGFSWLKNVSRAASPESTYSVDFKIRDFRGVLPAEKAENIHLRMTMMTDSALNDVAIADGQPPRVSGNIESPIKYVLAHRSGSQLDTLFTTVYEPYRGERYVASIEPVEMKVTAGTEGKDDVASAVKVTLKNGRVDYVVHATNNQVTYRIDDIFDFRGVFGVYREGFAYVNDGDLIGENHVDTPAYTGTIEDFTRDINLQNSITIRADQEIAVENLVGKFIFVNNDGVQNAAYQILSAKKDGANVILDLGSTTVIRKYIDPSDLAQGFIYNIGVGQTFRIPMGNEINS